MKVKELIIKGEIFYYFETKEEAIKFKTDNQFYYFIWKGAGYYTCTEHSIISVEQYIQNKENYANNLLEQCKELREHFV